MKEETIQMGGSPVYSGVFWDMHRDKPEVADFSCDDWRGGMILQFNGWTG